jgi:hypothetical protein
VADPVFKSNGSYTAEWSRLELTRSQSKDFIKFMAIVLILYMGKKADHDSAKDEISNIA